MLYIINISRSCALSYHISLLLQVLASASSYDRFMKIIQRLPPATNISDHAHQCGHHCRTFFSQTFSSSSSVSSFLGISVCEQESLSFHPRPKSRWSRHIGQCYSSVSFLHFFLLLLFLLLFSFSIFHFFLSALSILSSLRNTSHRPSVSIIFYNGRQETCVGLVR